MASRFSKFRNTTLCLTYIMRHLRTNPWKFKQLVQCARNISIVLLETNRCKFLHVLCFSYIQSNLKQKTDIVNKNTKCLLWLCPSIWTRACQIIKSYQVNQSLYFFFVAFVNGFSSEQIILKEPLNCS